MNENEHLIVCLMEECQEVAHACAKALRFGLKHAPEGKVIANDLFIMLELADVIGALELLQERQVLPIPAHAVQRHAIDTKKEKILSHLELARKNGTLT